MDDLERLVDELCCGMIRSATCTVTFSGSQVTTKRKQEASSEDLFRVSCRNSCSTTPVAP